MVGDEEGLYRRIEFWNLSNGNISATAFNDRRCQPSVDRASLRNSPEETKLQPSDGIVQLIAGEVRRVAPAIRVNPKEEQVHQIDVIYSPVNAGNPEGLHENLAHSHIEAAPEFLSQSRFMKLKEALARLAGNRRLIEPIEVPAEGKS